MKDNNIQNKITTSNNMTRTTTALLVVLTLALSGWSQLLAESASMTPTTTTTTTTTTLLLEENRPETTTPEFEKIEAKSISDSDDSTHNKLSVSKEAQETTTTDENLPSSEPKPTPTTVAAKQERPTVNLTETERIYTLGRRDEKDVVELFKSMERQMKRGIGAVVGSILPVALNRTSQVKINSECLGSMLKWTLGMSHLKSWALKMLDAAGKPSAGLFEGSMTMFGNYRQCTKIRVADEDETEFTGKFQEYFRGKYCIIQMKPWLPEKKRFYNLNAKIKGFSEKTEDEDGDGEANSEHMWYDKTLFEEFSDWFLAFNFIDIRFDVCIPSLCSREDLQSIINLLINSIGVKARILRCEMDAPDNVNASFINAVSIESDQVELLAVTSLMKTSVDSNNDSSRLAWFFMQRIGWALVPFFMIVLVLLATAYSVINETKDKKRNQYVQRNGIIRDRLSGGYEGNLGRAINSLSLKCSANGHLEVDYDKLADDKPLAIYGIRFILILWIMITEFAFLLRFEYLRELLMLKDLIFWWPLQFIINSTLQFDSMILITAFIMAYKNCLNEGVGCQPKAIRKYVLDKYIRLVPSILLVVAITILLPFLYRGPVWNDFVAKQASVCLANGWLNAFLLQNNLPFNEICLPNTWLIALEFQLVLLMAPVVYYLNKNYLHNLRGETSSDNSSTSDIAAIDIVGDYKKASRDSHELSFVNGSRRGTSKSLRQTTTTTTTTTNHQQTRSNGACYDDGNCAANKPFYWLRTLPGLVLVGCIVFGFAASFYNVYSKELPPSWLYTMADPDGRTIYFNEHLLNLFTHLAVFSMGLLAGLECRRAARLAKAIDANRRTTSSAALSEAPNGNTITSTTTTTNIIAFPLNNGRWARIGAKSSRPVKLDTIGSIAVITIMSAILFSTYGWSIGDLPDPLVAGLYDISSRFFWSLGLIWVLYKVSVPSELVANDDGSSSLKFSLLARTLGRPGMVSLGKLSFLIYILHPFVHTTVLAIQEQPIYSSWLMLFHVLLGNFALTLILASLVSVFVEMPFRNLLVRHCGSSLFLAHAIVSDGTSAAAATASSRSGH